MSAVKMRDILSLTGGQPLAGQIRSNEFVTLLPPSPNSNYFGYMRGMLFLL
ncbi:hypothetical protein DZA65_02177 [Dickeya dianthicola]|nr:hypothetical protein DDI_1969 [Dickeya dianthicola RNS04.9]AYC19064.1 hypothetical protein DZA65_02177 [Dickeya dianthicola]